MARRLIPKRLPQVDSVAYDKQEEREYGKAMTILLRANRAWDNMQKFREERARNKRYNYGDQWSDQVEYCGRMISEEDYIRMQGNIPLKNNLIRRLVKTVIGVYRNQNKTYVCTARDRDEQKLGETMSTLLEYNIKLNDKKELDARLFEEFLVSGLVAQKETYEMVGKRNECRSSNVDLNRLFIEGGMRDPRMDDIELVGELHDLSFGQLASTFAKSDAELRHLEEIYGNARNRDFMETYIATFNRNDEQIVSFFVPYDKTMCRVIEVWTKEQRKSLWCHDYLTGEAYIDSYSNLGAIKAENALRVEENKIVDAEGNIQLQVPEEQLPLIEYEYIIENYWYYRFLSPFGDVLAEGETPYSHGEHPYTIKAYPYLDGEIHPFVADVIDQQRYINHYIILNDFIVKSSSKGTLIVDESSIPDDLSIEDIAEEWTKYNGVIKLKLKDGAKVPQQMVNQSRVAGLQDMITLQMQLMDDVSGVHGALQGKNATSGTSGILYEQQANNASTSIIDILETFSSFLSSCATKKVKNMQQFYDEPIILRIAGRNAIATYDPMIMGGIDFDLSISESYDTPVYRAINNDLLMQFLNAQQITLEQLLEVGSFPFADRLLQMIRSNKEDLMNQQQQMNVQPNMMMQ
jgi:hypothetical protein